MSLLNISTAVFSKRRFLKYFYSVQFLSKRALEYPDVGTHENLYALPKQKHEKLFVNKCCFLSEGFQSIIVRLYFLPSLKVFISLTIVFPKIIEGKLHKDVQLR